MQQAALVPAADMKVTVISGGITNKLKKVEMPAGCGCPSLLVRIFGGLDLIDRDIENPTFEAVVTWYALPFLLLNVLVAVAVAVLVAVVRVVILSRLLRFQYHLLLGHVTRRWCSSHYKRFLLMLHAIHR